MRFALAMLAMLYVIVMGAGALAWVIISLRHYPPFVGMLAFIFLPPFIVAIVWTSWTLAELIDK